MSESDCHLFVVSTLVLENQTFEATKVATTNDCAGAFILIFPSIPLSRL